MKITNPLISAALMMISLNGFAAGSTKTCEFKVSGMTCASCATTLKIGVKKLDGIESVKASTDKGNAIISFNSTKTDEKKVKAAIDKTGYKATLKQCKA